MALSPFQHGVDQGNYIWEEASRHSVDGGFLTWKTLLEHAVLVVFSETKNNNRNLLRVSE